MNDWLNKPWVIRVISLVLAILIFIVISFDNQKNQADDVGFDSPFFSSSQETQSMDDIPVDIKIDEEKYVVSGVPQTVSVTLEGTFNIVTSTVTQKSFDVFVDLEGLEPGNYTVPLQHSGVSDRLDVNIEPEEVEVIIEERATKEFNVAVDYINGNQLAAGFELAETTVEPSTVAITSSNSVVDKISIVKAFVDVKGLDEPLQSKEVPVKVYDSQGNELNVRVEPSTVDVTVDVKNPNKTVPIDVKTAGEVQEGISITSITAEQEEVQVFAAEEVLDNIESIATEAIDLSEITEGTSVEVDLDIPSDIRKIEPETVTVTIEIEKTVEQTFEDIPIEVINLDQEFTLTLIEPSEDEMSVIVSGNEDKISNLAMEDIQLSIDVEGLEEGEHKLPIVIEELKDIDVEPEFNQVVVRIE